MPAFGNITSNDGESTPVTHTFVPQNIAANVASLLESTGVPLADKRLTVSLSKTADKNRSKVAIKLAWPITQDSTVNGVTIPVLTRTAYAEVNFTFDPTSTKQERKNLEYVIKNLLANSDINKVIEDLQSIY